MKNLWKVTVLFCLCSSLLAAPKSTTLNGFLKITGPNEDLKEFVLLAETPKKIPGGKIIIELNKYKFIVDPRLSDIPQPPTQELIQKALNDQLARSSFMKFVEDGGYYKVTGRVKTRPVGDKVGVIDIDRIERSETKMGAKAAAIFNFKELLRDKSIRPADHELLTEEGVLKDGLSFTHNFSAALLKVGVQVNEIDGKKLKIEDRSFLVTLEVKNNVKDESSVLGVLLTMRFLPYPIGAWGALKNEQGQVSYILKTRQELESILHAE